jgi:hypothetical protein
MISRQLKVPKRFNSKDHSDIFAPLLNDDSIMAVTRLKRKNRKDRAKSARRRQSLKIQNFQPVAKGVDIEKIKEEFKAKKAAAAKK